MLFDWDECNIAHVARHNVNPSEAEQVIRNAPVDLHHETRFGEERTRQLGVTNDGRTLVVVSTFLADKVRVITAHDANRRLRAYYVSIRR